MLPHRTSLSRSSFPLYTPYYVHRSNQGRKGAWEKEVLAWWLCQHTTARRRWVSERLGMGDESRVTQAIGRLKRNGRPELERLKKRLEQAYEDHNGELEVRI